MIETDWLEEHQEDSKPLSEQEKILLKGATPLQIKAYGNIDQETAEIMLVSYFVADPCEGDSPNTRAAEEVLETSLNGKMFQNRKLGMLFEEVSRYYKSEHKLLTYDNAALIWLNAGLSRNDANMIKSTLTDCKATAGVRRFDPRLVIHFFFGTYIQKLMDGIYRQACSDRTNPIIGPQEAWKKMREAVLRETGEPKGAVLRVTDWMGTYKDEIAWLQDMKINPERYMGCNCGIKAIDEKTKGFRKGQLTIFAGAHGGCKTMLMINVAYGLWERGYNVLFVSLEMEAKIIQLKFWCRATGEVHYSRAYNGGFSHPDDWATLERLNADLQKAEKEEERTKITEKIDRYKKALCKERGQEDASLMEKFVQKFEKTKKNHLKIMESDQSSKMKLSQLDRWLREEASSFKPDVVIVDYLALVDPEVSNPNRPDIGFGDICKMLISMGKQMGFCPISAAQFKRSAMARLREEGMENPEKAFLDTDDIGDSHQIGADATNVFMLYRKPGDPKLFVFSSKARYGEKDTTKGSVLQIDFESSTISDNGIEDIRAKNDEKNTADIWSIIPEASKQEDHLPGQEGFDNEPSPEGSSLDLSPEGDDDIWGDGKNNG